MKDSIPSHVEAHLYGILLITTIRRQQRPRTLTISGSGLGVSAENYFKDFKFDCTSASTTHYRQRNFVYS